MLTSRMAAPRGSRAAERLTSFDPVRRPRPALVEARLALDAHDRALVQLVDRRRAGVRARRPNPREDRVDQVLDAGLGGVEVEAGGADPFVEHFPARLIERAFEARPLAHGPV